MIIHDYSSLFMISNDYSWLGPRPGLARVAPNNQSLPDRVHFFHQLGPYESYEGVRTTIRRRISIRVFLEGSQVWLKQLLYQKSRKSLKIEEMGSTWLDMGPYSVRMKRTGSRKLSKCLPDLWDPIKIKKSRKSWKILEILPSRDSG